MLSKWATSNSCWADNEIDRPKEDTRPFKVKTILNGLKNSPVKRERRPKKQTWAQ